MTHYKQNSNINEVNEGVVSDLVFMLPYSYGNAFKGIDVISEYLCIERLLMLSGDVETNPGPVFSKHNLNEIEYIPPPKFVRKFLKLRKLVLRLQKDNSFWNETKSDLDEIMGRLPKIVSQSGSIMSQSLSDRFDRQVLSDIKAQMFSIPVSHNIGQDAKDYISRVTTETTDKMARLSSETILLIRELFQGFYDKIYSDCESFSDSIINFSTKLVKFLAISAVVYFLISRLTTIGSSASAIVGSLLTAVIVLLVDDIEMKKMLTDLVTRLQNFTVIRAQSGEGNFSLLSMLIPPLFLEAVGGNTTTVLKKIWNSKDIDLVMRRISYFGDGKIFSGIEKLGDWLRTIIDRSVEYFKVKFLGADPEEFLSNQSDPLTTWFEQCHTHFKSDISSKAVYTDGTLADVDRLYSAGVIYARQPLYRDHRNQIHKVLGDLIKFSEKIKKKVGTDASVRNKPVTIYLHGETGVGKSSVTYPLCTLLLKKIFTRENNMILLENLRHSYREMIYVRSAEQEYWDGYSKQLVTVFDDFNQQVDSASNPALELFEIIRASNNFPYPLHMANIEDKANTYFGSKIILVSSNNQSPKTESLNYPNALLRRFDLFVEVRRDRSAKEFSLDDYSFHTYNPLDKDHKSETLTSENLVDFLVDKYEGSKNFVASIDNYIMNTIFAQNGEQPQEEFHDTRTGETMEEECARMEAYLREHHPRLARTFEAYRNKREYTKWEKILQRIGNIMFLLKLVMAGIGLYKLFTPSKPTRPTRLNVEALFPNSEHLHACTTCKRAFFHVRTYNSRESYPIQCPFDDCAEFTGILVTGTRKALSEAYSEKDLKKKVEAYTEKNIKRKVESYTEKDLKKKVEAYTQKEVKKSVETIENNTGLSRDGLPLTDGLDVAEYKVLSEAVTDVNSHEQVDSLTRRNLYIMYIVLPGGESYRVGHAIFLRGKVCICPAHFMKNFAKAKSSHPDAFIQFEGLGGKRNFFTYIRDIQFTMYKTQNLLKVEHDEDSRDLMYFKVPSANVHADITSYFTERQEVRAVGTTRIKMPLLAYSKDQVYVSLRFANGSSCLRTYKDLTYNISENSDASITIRDAWQYHLDTRAGDCGAPLFVSNSAIGPGKVIGIHVAGSEARAFKQADCYAVPFYKEDVVAILSTIKAQSCFATKIKQELIPAETPEQYRDCEFIVHGKVPKVPVQPSKSKIRKSPLYEKITTPKTALTWLYPKEKDGEIFSPMEYRTKRMGKESVPIDQRRVEMAGRALTNHIYQQYLKKKELIEGRFPKKYEFEEAIVGVPGENFVNAIKRDTSVGYPLVTEGWTRAKMFGNEEEYNLNTPGVELLRNLVDDIINEVKDNNIPDLYFIDTLKDERKPIGKEHKTRMFANGSIQALVWAKMYFNPIVAVLGELANDCNVSVGTNVYSRDWDHIARKLKSKSNHFIAGDFEGFDASEQQALLLQAGEVLIELSRKIFDNDEENIHQMRAIIQSLCNSFHISEGGFVIQWLKSLPSGHYLTAIINSLLVNIAMCMCFMRSVNSYTYIIATIFFELFGIVAYGDDHIVSVPEKYIGVFNQQTLPSLLRELGMYYTLETKSDQEVTFKTRKLEEITYLKRSFAYDKKREQYIAPLSLDVILEMPMWTRASKDVEFNVQAVAELALKELSLHDEETWNRWSPVIIRNLEEHLNYVTSLRVHEEVRDIALSMSLGDF